MKTVLIGISNKKLFRIWFEGADLLKEGLNPGQRYDLSLNADGTITGTFDSNGARKISSKKKAGLKVPVLDIVNKAVHQWLETHGSPEAMSIKVLEDSFVLSPSKMDHNRKSRVSRFKKAVKTAVAVASIFSGIAVFDHAAHAAIPNATSAFQVEHNSTYASIAVTNNAPICAQTMINTPIQHAPDLPKCSLLIAGIPCNGASISGICKNGIKRPEQHTQVGNMIFYALRAIQESQPAYVLIENVTPYADSASGDILKHTLKDMGYRLSERVINGSEVGALEHRERWFLLGVSKGLPKADLNDIKLVNNSPYKTIADIIDPDVPDSMYRPDKPFEKKKLIDKDLGRGFSSCNQPIVDTDIKVKTIGAGYFRRRPSEPYYHDPEKGFRWFTPQEHARLKLIPERLVEGISATVAHEVLGQAGIYDVIYQITQSIFGDDSPQLTLDV